MRHRPAAVVVAAIAIALGGCGGSATTAQKQAAVRSPASSARTVPPASTTSTPDRGSTTTPVPPSSPASPTASALFPRLVSVSAPKAGFAPAVSWRGQTAVSIAQAPSGIALLSFNQALVELRLHAGTVDPGGSGWRYGWAPAGSERRLLIAGFNGGFKFSYGAGGFMSYGRVGAPLRDGLASIVTYTNGGTDIGAWHREVPNWPVATVRQNLTLLIDHGRAASTVGCLICWGSTLGGVVDPARSALGITAGGNLIWAGGEHVTVSQLADAMLRAGVVRAVELDINPAWVAAYLYGHRGSATAIPAPVPVMPGQNGVSGEFLAPYSRDYFTVIARQ